MSKILTLTGNPISTNHIYKHTGHRTYMTNEGKDIKEQYFYELKNQWKRKPIKTEVALNIILFFGDKRKRDIDNYNKVVLDSLSGIVIEDDSQIQVLHLEKQYDK